MSEWAWAPLTAAVDGAVTWGMPNDSRSNGSQRLSLISGTVPLQVQQLLPETFHQPVFAPAWIFLFW